MDEIIYETFKVQSNFALEVGVYIYNRSHTFGVGLLA